MPTINLTRLFCEADDFCNAFIPAWEKTQLNDGCKKRRRTRSLSPSEIIIVLYHSSGYRTFKWFYTHHQHLSQAFPKLVPYNRFIELLPDILISLTFFMKSRCATGKGIAFIDSTPLRVCDNLRISRYKTFKDEAQRGKSSTGWFYGFKRHLLVDDCGQILSFRITRGNVDDRKPVPSLLKNFIGKVFGDRGYLSKKLAELLALDDVELITSLKKNMAFDKLLLRKRCIIETINDQLKNIFDLEHSRHRSLSNYSNSTIKRLNRIQ
nr:IS982 family transposase [Beggiatoa leptomitoformis]